MSNDANVPAIAALIRATFPELQQRAFAIMEAAVTKENMPNLPLCFVALLGVEAENQSNNVRTPMDLLEHIIIEFWSAPTIYKKADGSASPFYAYQDYQSTLNKMLVALDGYFGPQGKSVRFASMSTTSDDFALMVSFKVSIKWRWRAEQEVLETPIKIKFGINPNVQKLPVGST